MIELKNVSKFYKGSTIAIGLKNINLKMSKNEFIAIIGASGAGKSTLLNVICGMDTYEEGEIYFKGNETSFFNDLDRDIFRKKNIALISQNYNLINSYTVLENVLVPLYVRGFDTKTANEMAINYIEKVGLSHVIKSKISHLSGGEKQRCVIARALATDCDILACDEPTGNLDSENGAQIIQLIKEVAKDKLVLIVTHNYAEVENVVTRTITLKDGEVISDVKKEEISDELNEPLDLVDKKITNKNLFKLLIQNIKGTPKKSFFIGIVHLILMFVLLFLILSSLTLKDQAKYNPDGRYYNNISNRLVVYDKDHKTLDLNKLSKIDGDRYLNAFYEETEVSLSLYDNNLSNSRPITKISGCFSYHLPDDFVMIEGDYPKGSNEVMLVMSYKQFSVYNEMLKSEIGGTFKFDNELLQNNGLIFCGYGYSYEVYDNLFYAHDDYSSELTASYIKNAKIKCTVDGETINITNTNINYYNEPNKTNRIVYYGPKDIEVTDLVVSLSGIYDFSIENFVVETNYYENVERYVVDICLPLKIDDVYEVVFYPKDVDKAAKIARDAGYIADTPGKVGFDKESETYIRYLTFILISIVSIIILSLIGLFIVSGIFESKTREYAILRSVGIIGSDLRKIILCSSIIINIVISIFVLLICYLGYLLNIDIFMIMKYNNVFIILCFFIYSLLFSLIVGIRADRRIARSNLSLTLKSEVL